jgi:signal transduction histidine kinase
VSSGAGRSIAPGIIGAVTWADLRRWRRLSSPRLAVWLAAGMCACIALLAWFGFTATRQFQQSSRLLEQRAADEAARLLVTALAVDMRGAHTSILASAAWDDLGADSAYELNALVASAFARYPYPEAFLAWDARQPDAEMTFYSRADRPPPWAPATAGRARYPVRTLANPDVANAILAIIRRDAIGGRPLVVADERIGGVRYQIVILLRFTDRLRQQLASARGFLVNLDWVREHYFPQLITQVAQIGGANRSLTRAILDEHGAVVSAAAPLGTATFSSQRAFPLAFYDPVLAAGAPAAKAPRTWSVLVTAGSDPALGLALRSAYLTLGLAALAACALAVGLAVTVRALRSAAELAELRAEFMSSVTHELKTPIASIQAMGETLSRGRLRDPGAQQQYAAVVTQQAKRLGRLVNNLLAHARITDVTGAYTFEPLDVEELIESSLAAFSHTLREGQHTLQVDVPPEVPPVLADRAAMELLFDNLIDNAIRHAGATRDIRVTVRALDTAVRVEISDRGIGIAPDDLARVTEKFVRGRNAPAGGSGLGLAIVSRIVNDHRGTLAIESALGIGTTVAVTLPAVTA